MPLGDHFHPPLNQRRHWQSLHGFWPGKMADNLNPRLPDHYYVEARVQVGNQFAIDIGTFEEERKPEFAPFQDRSGGTATAVWAPAKSSLSQETELPAEDEFELLIHESSEQRLVAAVEIVSPANKDRPRSRRAFVGKCANLLRHGVSVTIVDVVTGRHFNLYRDLVAELGLDLPVSAACAIYASSCRGTPRAGKWLVEAWEEPLAIGQPLPTIPIWLTGQLAIPLDLEASYLETCRTIRLS